MRIKRKEIKGAKIKEYGKKPKKSKLKKVRKSPSIIKKDDRKAFIEKLSKEIQEIAGNDHKSTSSQKIKQLEEIKKTLDKKLIFQLKLSNTEKEAFITYVAREDLAKRFTTHQLKCADLREHDGITVHGYLEEAYPDDWEALLDIEIFDRAVYYAEQYPKPEIVKFTSDIDLKKLIKTPVLFEKEIKLDNYPHQSFDRCVILAKTHFKDAVNWVSKYPKDFDGVEVPIRHASFNLALLGWAMPDFPIFLLLHAPGKDEGINDARVHANDIDKIKVDIRQKLITVQRNELSPLEAQLLKESDRANKWREEYNDLENEMLFERNRSILRRKTLSFSSPGDVSKLTFSHLILIIMLIITTILAIIGMVT